MLRKIGLFFCSMGWHGKTVFIRHDGASSHEKCTRCGYVGMRDSQGNLF